MLSSVSTGAAQDFTAEFNRQWGLKMIGVDKALALGLDGSGVRVGVTDTGLDTGLDPDYLLHPELAGRYIGLGLDGYWNSELWYDGDPNDEKFHGTHVAGTIAANRDGLGMVGVASGSTIVPMRIIEGGGLYTEAAALGNAVSYGLANNVRIFNASWGIWSGYNYFYNPITRVQTPFAANTILSDYSAQIAALRSVVAADGIMVFATGNWRNHDPLMPLQFQAALPYYLPELERGWLAVTSVGPTGQIAAYAQLCSVGMMWCLAAPGGDQSLANIPPGYGDGGIYAPQPVYNDPAEPYISIEGTSMAAPHVSGALAIAKQLYPNASYQQLRMLVLQTATDIGAQGIDPVYGWGLLNVGNIVDTASATAGAAYAQQSFARQGVVNHLIDTLNPNASPERGGTWGYWVQPLGITGEISSGPSATILAGGFSAGIEGSFVPDWYLKAFGAFSQSSVTSGGNSALDTGFHLGGQVLYESPTWFADTTIGASLFAGSVERRSAAGMAGTVIGGGGVIGSSTSTDTAQWAAFRLGHHFETESAGTFTPYLLGRLANQQLSPFSESGAVLGISGAGANVVSGELGIGLKWRGPAWTVETLDITPVLDVAYSRQAGDYSRNFNLLGNAMTANTPIGGDTLQISTALEMTSSESPFDLKLGYSAQIQSGSLIHAASLKLMGAF